MGKASLRPAVHIQICLLFYEGLHSLARNKIVTIINSRYLVAKGEGDISSSLILCDSDTVPPPSNE